MGCLYGILWRSFFDNFLEIFFFFSNAKGKIISTCKNNKPWKTLKKYKPFHPYFLIFQSPADSGGGN